MFIQYTTTDKGQMMKGAPFGPAFTPKQVEQAQRMELWATTFLDPGPDYSEFRLIGSGGEEIATATTPGY